MALPGHLNGLSPAELRLLIRQNDSRISTSTGLAKGYQHANVIILPSFLANDFEAFCRSNPAPLPLLYRSLPGETSCMPLARQVDIRTDVAQYCVYEEGQLVQKVSSLLSYTNQPRNASEQQTVHHWSDMVCFYLGCSYGFEGSLQRAGVPVRNVEQGRIIGMYKTAVPCIPVGAFSGPLVVSMRPIPAAMLDVAVEISYLSPLAHGVPVHIGDPALLGIQDVSRPDYGEQIDLLPGDVPVFWACGVTAIEALHNCRPPLAFSHSPGRTLLTDIPDSSTPPSTSHPDSKTNLLPTPNPELSPRCFLVSHKPLLYSLVSQRAVARIRRLETVIGHREITQDELLHCCLSLSHSASVAISTGFPTHYMHSPPDETDGPPGAIAMATMLLSLGKKVTMVTDKRALEMNQAIIDEAVKTGVLKTAIPLLTFEDSGPDSALHFLCYHGDPSRPRYDHLVAIERSGRAADGNDCNMRGVNIKHLVDPVGNLFTAAKDISGITTTGVSSWGGYAVVCGLFLLSTCPSHQQYLKKGLGEEPAAPPEQLQNWTVTLPSVDKEGSFLSTLMHFGVRSGKTGHLAMEVDGLTFHPTHSDIITRLLEVTLSPASQNP